MECGDGKENMLKSKKIKKKIQIRKKSCTRTVACFLLLSVISLVLWGCKPKDQEPQWLEESVETQPQAEGQTPDSPGQSPVGETNSTESGAQTAEIPGEDAQSAPGEISGTTSETSAEPRELYVHVCGAVANPGVYVLPEGSRVVDAVMAAGGTTADASGEALNQALAVTDGMQVYVPNTEEAEQFQDWIHTGEMSSQTGNSGGSASTGTDSAGKVNINTADVSTLCTLPGIGESRAASIVAYREEHGGFSSIEDIMKVSGIKDAAFGKIKDKICVK